MIPFIIAAAAVVAGVGYAIKRFSNKYSEDELELHLQYEEGEIQVISGKPRPRIISALKDVLKSHSSSLAIYMLKDGSADVDGSASDSLKQRIRNTISAES